MLMLFDCQVAWIRNRNSSLFLSPSHISRLFCAFGWSQQASYSYWRQSVQVLLLSLLSIILQHKAAMFTPFDGFGVEETISEKSEKKILTNMDR